MSSKVKACNQIQFFTPERKCTCDELDKVRFNCQFKNFKISNIKRVNIIASFYHILLLLSGDISLNPGPKNNLQPLNSNGMFLNQKDST